MYLEKYKLQNLFLIIISIIISLNGSINPLLIQISSISFIFFFILCLNNLEIKENIKNLYKDNKIFFLIFFIYLGFLTLQLIPLPLKLIEIIASNNYNLYTSINIDKEFWSLSIDPSNSYFGILNNINFLIIFLTFPVLFNRSQYLMKFFFFICFLGFCHATFATYWMLIGNPSNFLIQKIHYLNASTGLYVNRVVFGTFLYLSAFCGLYYIVIYFQKNKISNFNFFDQLKSKIFYIRIFIIFLSVGILTTWSRAANLSYILILFSFLIYSKIFFRKYVNPLSIIIIFVLIFDVLVMTIFFGNARLVERLVEVPILKDFVRINLISFGFEQFKNFWLFGYGSGGFGQIFKIFYEIPVDTSYVFFAEHAHNDGIELLGEIGILGLFILSLLYFLYFYKIIKNINEKKEFSRFMLISLLLLILFIQSFVDYSLHVPGIMTLLMTILSIGIMNFKTKIIS